MSNCNTINEALLDFSQAIQLDPTFVPAYISRGTVYAELQRYEESLADFNRAIQLNPYNTTAYIERGLTYERLNHYDDALADYERAIQLGASDASLYIVTGALLGNLGKTREALPYFEKAAQLGDTLGAQYVAQAKQMIEVEHIPWFQALAAFRTADSLKDMRRIEESFPFVTNSDFIGEVARLIARDVPPDLKPALEQRLSWLRQIAEEQKREEQD